MPPLTDAERATRQIAQAYATSWQRIIAEQQALLDHPEQWRRRARLDELARSISRELDDLDAKTRQWIERRFPELYATGARSAAAETGGTFGWSLPHREAVAYLAQRTFDELLAATNGVRESTKRLIREVAATELRDAAISGRTSAQLRRSITKQIVERAGIHSVTYKNGARFPLDAYAEMIARTEARLATTSGLLNTAHEQGVAFYELLDGPDCGLSDHRSPQKADGMIVDARSLASYPISHPNCIRVPIARPDLKTKAQAKEAGPLVTAASRTDQTAFTRFLEAQGLTKTGRVRRGSTRAEALTRREARRNPQGVFNRFLRAEQQRNRPGRQTGERIPGRGRAPRVQRERRRERRPRG